MKISKEANGKCCNISETYPNWSGDSPFKEFYYELFKLCLWRKMSFNETLPEMITQTI